MIKPNNPEGNQSKPTLGELASNTRLDIPNTTPGAIDFRDRSKLNDPKKASKSKTKRFSFWQDFIDNVGAVHMIRIPTIKPNLEEYQATFNWLEKMASKTLAILFYVIGQEKFISYIYGLVKVGESKFTPQDKKRIEYLRGNQDYLDFD